MTSKDLKSGMVVLFDAGYLGLVVGKTIITARHGGKLIKHLSNNLHEGRYSISEIYDPRDVNLQADMQFWLNHGHFVTSADIPCIWKYEQKVEEITMTQLCKELGRNIKIIPEN